MHQVKQLSDDLFSLLTYHAHPAGQVSQSIIIEPTNLLTLDQDGIEKQAKGFQ